MVSYSKAFCHCLESGNLSDLLELSPAKRRCVMSSLSNLAKYLGIYETWKGLVRQYNLKWADKSKDEIVIDRITKVKDSEEVFKWIRQVKSARPDFSDFMDLMAVSGMRMVEAVESYNLIIKLSREGRLSEYYNEGMEALEHYKFKDKFLRKSKKAFVSFVPKELVYRIASKRNKLNRYSIQTATKRAGLPLRFGDIREVHGSILSKYLTEPEINFLQGRISGSVFMTNYFNPKWITDFKQRVFNCIREVQMKIS